jgi:NADH:ubiquinone oxidoreductase subunit K
MRERPANIVLATFAILLLADIIIEGFKGGGNFLISFGVFGALLSRALLDDPQSIGIVLLGFALTLFAVGRNHGTIDPLSGGWFFLTIVVALAYALWEKIVAWFSL